MKKILILFIIILNSCSNDEVTKFPQTVEETCYTIIARGYDERGNYIIIKISDFNNKRYQVQNYQNWSKTIKLCEPITLIQQPL